MALVHLALGYCRSNAILHLTPRAVANAGVSYATCWCILALEDIFCIKLTNFLAAEKVISESQFGFQKGKSTELAIAEIHDRIVDALSKGLWCCGIFLDLSKAFDTLDHKILLHKLYLSGIRGKAYEWIIPVLQRRGRRVRQRDGASRPARENGVDHRDARRSRRRPFTCIPWVEDNRAGHPARADGL